MNVVIGCTFVLILMMPFRRSVSHNRVKIILMDFGKNMIIYFEITKL